MPGLLPRPLTLGLLAGAAAAALGGCRTFSKAEADREVACTLAQYRALVPEAAGSLDVDAAEHVARAARSRKPLRLALGDALALACAASREYRGAREDAFLAALDLTGARNEFRVQRFASGRGDLVLEGAGAEASAGTDLSLSKAFETGGSLVLSLASDFLRGLSTENPAKLAQTILRLDLLLPIGRGANRLVAREPLTQAERDTLYALRTYARFQQEFSVRIARAFWEVLQARDTLENERRSLESLGKLLVRQEALGAEQAGRIPDFQVDQARQDRLRAEERVLVAEASYESALDRFKLDLGIYTDLELELVAEDLAGAVPDRPPPGADEGARVALQRRLDLRTARDREEDARRQVLVARDALGAEANLSAAGQLATPERSPLDVRDAEPRGELGLDLDLPFERTAERNAHRAALVAEQRARRAREEAEDRAVLEVRAAWRRLKTAETSRDIQVRGVELAARRVESTDLLLEAGRADTRDRLEAEEALLQARNALTRANVEFAVARLELERDMGTLLVDERCAWRPWFDARVASPAAAQGGCPPPPRPPPPPPPPSPPAPPASGN